MANKAKTDGVDFQRHLYYYVIGLVHRQYDYSVLYEGNENTYGALDDVILKVHGNGQKACHGGLYLFQAKQIMDAKKTLSIQDVLHGKKSNIDKYIDAYTTYKGSEAQHRDGMPTEMIYWTTNDFHVTTKKFIEVHTSSKPHLAITIDSIKKYRIKRWKALFMFDTAQQLANECKSQFRKKDTSKSLTYLNETVADAVAGEILELAEQQADSKPKVRFREQFLNDSECLSDNAKQFRFSFIIACEILYTNPIVRTFDITSLSSATFSTDAFSLEKINAPDVNPAVHSFQYKSLDEEMLNWFFERFTFYVGVPKDDPMVLEIDDLFNNQFRENKATFDRYLIDEPLKRAQTQEKDRKQQQQQDCFITKSCISSVMDMIELKNKLAVQQPKGIEFKKENLEKLYTNIKHCLNASVGELTVLSKTKVEWTAARITKKIENSLVVSNGEDMKLLQKAFRTIQDAPFGECLISGEAAFVVLLDLPDIAHCSRQITEQFEQKVKVIAIVSEQVASDRRLLNAVVDEVELCDVIVDYEQLEIKYISFDDKNLPFSCSLANETIDSITKLEELSTLTDIKVKSDVYLSGERYYIDRNLLGTGQPIVTHADLLSRPASTVSIISDTAGQGKTTELLRIAELAQNVDDTICLYMRAKTIAKGMGQDDHISSLNGLQLLQKLLYITPRSELVEEIVRQSLAKMQVCLLVDGFDEVIGQYQDVIVKLLQKVLQSCSLIIATRQDSLPVLKKAFKNVSNYGLATFPYDKYFQRLWLSDPNEITPDLEQNVQIFISNFDKLLKGTGCKTFLEVPQLCKIMGTIYRDRIRKPNIHWHTNYEIGSIYDTFVQSQLENTLCGKFDETDKLHVWARSLIKSEFYTKHTQLAYELEYNCYSNLEHYEQLQRFGLIVIQFDTVKSINFMHRTVMDYFLVRICMLDDIDKEDFHSFLKRYFCVSRTNIADKFIDFFLHDAQCLSLRKKDIISAYLYSSPDILPTYIRTALNNATFNTLRVLLSAAPRALLKHLCFRFGATNIVQGNSSNEINLKRLGERQTLLLLETLKSCDDEYVDAANVDGEFSILERMLFEANPNEEDTMEVAIRKPFPDVFDWVVAYCTEHFNEAVERYLMERIPRYAQTLIRHCYSENKEKIIDKLLQLCKTSFPDGLVRKCLQSFDVLEMLILNIEVVPQGKQFKEVDRIDLTRKILEILDVYVDEESLICLKNQSRERVETLQNEAVKSLLKQWTNVTTGVAPTTVNAPEKNI